MANYNKYAPELREKVLRLYLEEGRTKKNLRKNTILDKEQSPIGYDNYFIFQVD